MKLETAVKNTMSSVLSEVNSVISNQNNLKDEKLVLLKNNIGKIVSIPIDDILIDENVRNNVETNTYEFFRLVESIRENGVLQSIVVELRETADGFKLICVAGHRRILASKSVGIQKIPCLIKSFTSGSQRTGAALSENINRENLYCLDIAEGYAELLASGWSEEKISIHFEKDKRTIKRYLTMANWSDEAKNIVRENKEKFPTRVLINEYVSRNYSSNEELESALLTKLQKNIEPKKKNISVKHKLNKFFIEKDINDEVKSKILEALNYIGILNNSSP